MVKKQNTDMLFQAGIRQFLKAMLDNGVGNSTSSTVSRKADVTYSHIVRLRTMLKDMGLLVEEDKIGRMKPISLTEKGEQVAKLFEQIYRLVE